MPKNQQTQMDMEEYFKDLEDEAKREYEIAAKARKKGFDPRLEVEIPLAKDLAQRVEGLVGPKGVSSRIRELGEKSSKEEVAIEIAKEIVQGRFGQFGSIEEASEQALRTSLAILTEGIVAAPLEGIVKVEIKTNYDNSKYLAIYFAGPIRSAGGSAQALAVLTGDYIRQNLDLEKYSPTDDEIERFAEEVDLYNIEAARLQYLPHSSEVRKAVRNIPIEITGESTEKVEVSGYRDLERIETNQLRGGAVLVLAEGVLQKAPKILKYVKRFNLKGWDWLNDFVLAKVEDEEKEVEIKPSYKYIKDLIAGRPVLSHPSEKGGFRLRYGRCRNSGFASCSIHPALLMLLDDFIVTGTQLKTERPGKGTAITPCDTIEGPIVKLNDGSVVRVEGKEDAEKLRNSVREILFLGDILISYGEFLENNHVLMPAGYSEEWWSQELEKESNGSNEEFKKFLDVKKIPTSHEAIEISEKLDVPLHPRYNYSYHDVTKDELRDLVTWLCGGEIKGGGGGDGDGGGDNGGLEVVNKPEEKKILEKLGVPHNVRGSKITIDEYPPLLRVLGIGGLSPENLDEFYKVFEKARTPMEIVNSFGIRVKEKAPTYIGARMGRPEKAKERKMQPPVNVLFPIGKHGGRTRDVTKAAGKNVIKVEVARRECPKCGEVTFKTLCQRCNTETDLKRVCMSCGTVTDEKTCPACKKRTRFFEKRNVEIKEIFRSALSRVGNSYKDVKGVIGMTSTYKIPEPIEKGILRSKNEVYVFKDGTTRFDSTDVPLTHFRPDEIGVSVENVKALGYDTDHRGDPLTSGDQVVEIKCQDIILPNSGADYLIKTSKFIDELLVKLYEMSPFYNVEKKEDLIGLLIIGLAPHTSAAILGRIIGFTKANVGYAHPYFHAAKRRNCLLPETEVLVLTGGRPALKTLEEIYRDGNGGGNRWGDGDGNGDGNGHRDFVEEICDDFGTKERKIDLKTLALNPENNRFEIKRIKSIIKAPSPENLITIKSRTGRKIVTTPEHRHLVFNDKKPRFKKGVELSDKDSLILPERLEIEGRDTTEIDILLEFDRLNLGENVMVRGIGDTIKGLVGRPGGLKEAARRLELNKKTFSNYVYRDSIPFSILKKLLGLNGKDMSFVPADCRIGFKRDAISVPRFINVDRTFMRLIGYYLAEGHARSIPKGCYQIDFAASEEEIRDDIESIVKKNFGITPSSGKSRITVSSRVVYHLFVDVLKIGNGARDKRVPEAMLALPKFKIKELLGAYFAGDGCVEKGRLHVTCSSVNEGLLRDVGFLLLRFGIFYRIKSEDRGPTGAAAKFYAHKGLKPSFKLQSLSIRSTYARIFCDEIGFASGRKQETLEKAIEKERAPRLKKVGGLVLDPIKEIVIEKSRSDFVYDLTVEDHHNFLINDFIVTGNCDGDEDSVFLLLDALINFSKCYLPSTRGSTMDAPLVLTTRLDPKEIDDEAHNIDIVDRYPLEFYEAASRYAKPQEMDGVIEIVNNRIGKAEQYFNLRFTHDNTDIASGPVMSSYKTLSSMPEKVKHQLALAKKIRAVDERDVAKRVIESHFLPDLAGNLRAFSKQTTRCVSCNAKYRRVPLSGKCHKCGGGKLILTVHKGSVEKYLEITKRLINEYQLDDYLRQRVEILEMSISSVFDEDGVKQVSLSDFL